MLQKFRTLLKGLKIFNYLNENMSYNGVLFLQVKMKLNEKKKFKGELFFSYGKTNSCGVAIGYTGKRSFQFSKQKNDENGRFLILGAMIDDYVFILINLHNSNT